MKLVMLDDGGGGIRTWEQRRELLGKQYYTTMANGDLPRSVLPLAYKCIST